MRQEQGLQANIDYAQSQLNRMLNLIPANEVEKYHFANDIKAYKKEIAELKRCLRSALELNK
jgi:peptidoglycan hydrolase CwlO-like protein